MHEHARNASYDNNPNSHVQSKGCMNIPRVRVTITILTLMRKVAMHEHAKDASYDNNPNAHVKKQCTNILRMQVTITILMFI